MPKLLRGRELYEAMIADHIRTMRENEECDVYNGEEGMHYRNADEKELERLRQKLNKYTRN